jgi:hypothetical protein
MYGKPATGWRCRSCGYDNDPDAPACVYCGEYNADEAAFFEDVPLEDEEDEL